VSKIKPGAILSVGRVYCDLVFSDFPHMPVLGEEVYAEQFAAHAGGGAYITAAHLAATGHETALCAVLPAGPLGTVVHDEVAKSKIDVRPSVFASPEWGHQITIAMAHGGDRSFLTKRGGFAVPQNCEAEIASKSYRHLHIAELATLVECPDLVTWARREGLTISLDCSWDVSAMRRADVIELISGVDVFLPNLAELKFVMQVEGELVPSQVSQAFGEGCIVVVKRGADGASLISNGSEISCSAHKTKLVDATGAGDAFNAGFIAEWLGGGANLNCLLAGTKQASVAVAMLGGASFCADADQTKSVDLQNQASQCSVNG